MKTYLAKLKHDDGILRLHVTASCEDSAIQMIMKAEGCPANSVLSLKELTEKQQQRRVG